MLPLIIVSVFINVGNFMRSGTIPCRTHDWVFNFSKSMQTFAVIILNYFVKGFCCLHKIESPTFIHKLNQQLQVFFLYLPIQIKTTFLFYCVYIPATCCILWVSHRPLRFKHRKDHTTQRESNVNE